MASAKATIDRDEIQKWVESRGGFPAHVKRTGAGDDLGVLRIDYPGYSGQGTLERITWDEFFQAFDSNNLAFLYQPTGNSRFSKLVDRGSVELTGGGRSLIARAASALLGRGAGSPSSKTGKRGRAASAKKRSASSKKRATSSKKRSTSSKKRSSSSKKSSAKRSSSKKSSKKR